MTHVSIYLVVYEGVCTDNVIYYLLQIYHIIDTKSPVHHHDCSICLNVLHARSLSLTPTPTHFLCFCLLVTGVALGEMATPLRLLFVLAGLAFSLSSLACMLTNRKQCLSGKFLLESNASCGRHACVGFESSHKLAYAALTVFY